MGTFTLVDHFQGVLSARSDQQMYRFLADGENDTLSLTGGELDQWARAIAVELRDRVPAGARALIVCPPGLDYVASFFGCLYAGVIAVPVYPPNPALLKRTLPRLLGVIADALPAVALAPSLVASIAPDLAEYAPALAELPWLAVDEVERARADEWRRPPIGGQDVAFLQYTSGSTGDPKGVVVSHENLLHNLASIRKLFVGDTSGGYVVSWLPPYHDMGLIGGLLQPAYVGLGVGFMSPLSFLKRPGRWLRAISDSRAVYSGGPNFAYDLCLAKIPEHEREGLDLSSWEVAFTGAEPVNPDTIERFAREFAPYGFRRSAFYPCYGLAEGTLLVTGGDRAAEPVIREFAAEALKNDTAIAAAPGDAVRRLVGCGATVPGQEVVIADPVTHTRLPDGKVGEIWVSGPSVAQGYWRRPVESAEFFHARLSDGGTATYLRTGDLGFLYGGELHVAGRRKDLIIVAGRNHYPQDIERSVEASHPALRPGCGVACALDGDGGGERLLIVHEVNGDPARLDLDEVVTAIRAAVAIEHDLAVHEIVLVRRGGVPKTSSGKPQRSACRAAFLDGELDRSVSWSLRSAAEAPVAEAAASAHDQEGRTSGGGAPGGRAAGDALSRVRIDRWLREEIARRLGVSPATVDTEQPIATFGLSSLDMVGIAGDLENLLGRTLPATLIWEYPTIDALADHLSAPDGSWRDGVAPDDSLRDGVASAGSSADGVSREGSWRDGVAPNGSSRDEVAPNGSWRNGAASDGSLSGGVASAGSSGNGVPRQRSSWDGRSDALVSDGPSPDAAPPRTAARVTARADQPVASRPHGDAGLEPIAIVGIGCRFPGGADGPESFWRLLCEGRDAITEVPPGRWNAADFDEDPETSDKLATRWGGFLDQVDQFDPHFFGITPHEADRIDPQQRLLAEVAWEALEDAGVPAERLAGSRTGVFIGIATNDHGHLRFQDLSRIDAYTGTGNALSIAANRLSYLFDLRGPSMAIDTACSSSLVAIHQACRSLAAGDCTLALAGGVNVILSPALAINFAKAGAMAADGRCKAFDADADGYVRAEGAGVVVLKPLGRALADRDTVYAVIRGGAVNQDGRTNGLMAPNPHAQQAVLSAAYANAGLAPEQVDYVEAHGTGTLLGDPIEARALASVVSSGRPADRPCLIGSVKSNIGHLEAAAGVAGLIKAALMLHNRRIPPSLHYRRPNPHIPFGELRLRVVDGLTPWPSVDRPATVGVSSFGFGGTNAHMILQEAPPPPPAPASARESQVTGSAFDRASVSTTEPAAEPAPPYPLVISARNEDALRELAQRYEAELAASDATPYRLCAAAAVRRTHHEARLACVGESVAELRAGLAAFVRGEDAPGLSHGRRRVGRRPRTVFVFSGQGPRWWPLAGDLIDAEPVVRESLRRSDALLREQAGWSLLELIAAGPEDSRLAEPEIGQPALCAVQIAVAALWRSWGVEPAAVVGHSIGEIAAAHVAGALSLEDALRTALHRGQVISGAVGTGKMAVVALPMEQVAHLLEELHLRAVWVAASNGPSSTVVSGAAVQIERLATLLDRRGVFCRVLESVDYPSHCPLMDPFAAELGRSLDFLTPRPAAIPIVSTVLGGPVGGAELDADYWAANLRQPVLLDQAVTGLAEEGHEVFVEISPHPMLGGVIAERLSERDENGVVVASLRRDQPGRASMLGELGRLYTGGYPIDWTTIYGDAPVMVRLPSYPWQRRRHWLDDERPRRRSAQRTGHPALQTSVRSAAEPRAYHWTAAIDLATYPYLGDHRVAGAAVLPAAWMLDAALAAARKATGEPLTVIEDVHFTRMAVVPDAATEATVQLVLVPEAGGVGSATLFSLEADTWTEIARARYRRGHEADRPGALAEVRERCREPLPPAEHYAALSRSGLEYGPAFQGVGELWRGRGEALARLDLPAGPAADRDPYQIHPALLDACLQALAAALPPSEGRTYLPVAVGAFTLTDARVAPRWAHATAGAIGPMIDGCRVVLYDEDGDHAGTIDGIVLRPLRERDPIAESLLHLAWYADDTTGEDRESDQGQDGDRQHDRFHDRQDDGNASAIGWWLVFADHTGACDALRSELQTRGGACVTVMRGDRYRRVGRDAYLIDPERREDIAALLNELTAARPEPCAGIVYAWALDAIEGDHASGDEDPPGDLGNGPVLHLVQELAGRDWAPSPRLVLVTRGAQRVGAETTPVAPVGTALWGLARVIMLEHGELRPVIIDLDPDRRDGEAVLLVRELLRHDGGQETPLTQVAVRDGTRYLPALRPWTRPDETKVDWPSRPYDPRVDRNVRILAARPGLLSSLTPTSWERVPPAPGQIEIEVAAAGLNFSDVLKAMDICPGQPPGVLPLGAECAGTVVAVGEGVTGLTVGDRVMAVAPSSMAAFATTTAKLAAPIPPNLSTQEAAGVPIAFLTAVYALEYLARLGEGETVLIHSATGGVGMAALQVARRAGARVLATAGTAAKRDLLRQWGVEQVMDSRSLRFAEQVREATGGRGVDVVLNSLAGEALVRSLSLLAPGGRFAEIGKQDVYQDGHLNLGALRHDRSFFAVDLERTLAERPDLIADLFDRIGRGFASGDFTALPVTDFRYGDAEAAFTHMAQARHTGKIVLVPGGHDTIAVRPGRNPIRADATYLITGGLGALGLEAATLLAARGARHLALVGRRPPSERAGAAIDRLRADGVRVEVRTADVAGYADVTALLSELDASMPPLAGVVHAAGVLDDGLLTKLDARRLRSVAAGKALGAWHLHRATLGRDLDLFVLYSSAAGLVGSAGQGNYAAANAFLDGLAYHRRASGLPALSIAWGPWAEIGLAARPGRGDALAAVGVVALRPNDGAEILDKLLASDAAHIGVLPLDLDRLASAARDGLAPDLLARLVADADASVAGESSDGAARSAEMRGRLLAVEPGRRRTAILVRHCQEELARVIKADPAEIDPAAPLAGMGLDSLMAVQLAKRLEASLGVTLSATVAWRFPTIEALVPYLAERMGIELAPAQANGVRGGTGGDVGDADTNDGPDTGADAGADAGDGGGPELEELSEAELEALLLDKITQVEQGLKDSLPPHI
ncbi:SDR family NAD(P)-dependent oxidoreductase [Thermopolyspora sp. NPDC052614]|uniref:SDR family NAD(P)-dependent oxidoreductase n=1 Tax=Thermopolyspora sp. NPDC052614 TaxID=3155682 RepID=UPI003448D524